MKGIKTLLYHFLLATCPAVLILVAAYIILDPFMTLRSYDDYSPDDRFRPRPNKGLVVIENLKKHYNEQEYNSFIFGSSYSMTYMVEDWTQHLPAGSSLIHLDSMGESLYSLRLKLQFLREHGVKIDHAMVVMGPNIFSFDDKNDVTYLNHWDIDPNRSWIDYQWTVFKQFFNLQFLRGYIISSINSDIGINFYHTFSTYDFTLDALTNEELFSRLESEIARDPLGYEKSHHINRHVGEEAREFVSCVTNHSKSDAHAVANLLKEAGTDYIVVIGPRIDRRYIHPKDLKIIQGAFGADRVFDFSREMVGVADSLNAFYDNEGHYRPWVAREIMRRAYSRRAALSDGE